MRKHLLSSVAVMLLCAGSATAQRAAPWHDSTTRLDSAIRLLRDSLRQLDSTTATVAASGELHIAASVTERPAAVEVLQEFARIRDRRFRGVSPTAGGFRIVIHTSGTTRQKGELVLAADPDAANAMRGERTVAEGRAAAQMADIFGEMMIASLPAISRWIESPPPLSLDDTQRRDETMYTFVTSNGAIEKRCVGGGLVACQVALRLREIDGPENGGRFSPFVRTDLLYFALDQGGDGAWTRLHDANDTTVIGRLVAASGMPADTLISRWRADLLARRPEATLLSAHSVLIALAWSGLLLAGTLGAARWV